jgi:pimeloyl-ACP methyl ester carboxylesterase
VPEITHLWTETAGQRIHALHAGSGDRIILLLHGGGIDSARLSWELLIPELAQNAQVFAPDWPGYGQSRRPDTPFQLTDCIALLPHLMDAWEISSASLAGISLGGGIAMGFALDHPDRVERLVLADSYGLQRRVPFHELSYLYVHTPLALELTWALIKNRPMVRWTLKSLFYNDDRVTKEIEDQVYAEIMQPGAGKSFAAIQKHDVMWEGVRTCFMDRIGAIKAPTLIIHGENDNLVPLECSKQANAKIPDSRLHVLPKCGHWPQRDCPEAFNQVVCEFLLQD